MAVGSVCNVIKHVGSVQEYPQTALHVSTTTSLSQQLKPIPPLPHAQTSAPPSTTHHHLQCNASYVLFHAYRATLKVIASHVLLGI